MLLTGFDAPVGQVLSSESMLLQAVARWNRTCGRRMRYVVILAVWRICATLSRVMAGR
jgi:type I site-specific restriction-modification system R (restriction) subunit